MSDVTNLKAAAVPYSSIVGSGVGFTDDSICEPSLNPNKSSGDIGELKPCPWCGSTASRVRIMSRDAIQCDGENCGVIKRTPDEWNTRTPDPESAAEIERLRREVERLTRLSVTFTLHIWRI